LSPLLFVLAEHAPNEGVDVGGHLVSHIVFADDLALLARTAAHMQRLLTALDIFCLMFDMQVNMHVHWGMVPFSKTQGMVFHRLRARPPAEWAYRGCPIPIVEQFGYLGLLFHALP
jgi:hypothetical protein